MSLKDNQLKIVTREIERLGNLLDANNVIDPEKYKFYQNIITTTAQIEETQYRQGEQLDALMFEIARLHGVLDANHIIDPDKPNFYTELFAAVQTTRQQYKSR